MPNNGTPTPEWYAKVALGRIKGKPSIDLSRKATLTFVRSIFESCSIIDDAYYHDIGTAAYFVDQNDDIAGLNFACPGCGRVTCISFKRAEEALRLQRGGTPAWEWNGNKEKPTCAPSISHNDTKGGCGWHGFLTDGQLRP